MRQLMCLHRRHPDLHEDIGGAPSGTAKGLRQLREKRFFAGHDKSTGAQPEVEYRGFILGKHGIMPQPVMLLANRHGPLPGSVTGARCFSGICGFYQRFVADYATVAAPLTYLMQKNKDWA